MKRTALDYVITTIIIGGAPVSRTLRTGFSRVIIPIAGLCILSSTPAFAASSSPHVVSNSDKTASVSLPDGWTLAKGGNGFLYVTGPHDERLNLGVLVVAKNAASGTPVSGEVAFALPFRSSLKDKFTAILQAGAAKQGLPTPQITVASETKTKLPLCEMLLGGLTSGSQQRKFESVVCSLQPDYLGLYKNLVFLAQAPSDRAAADRPVIEKIVASYRVTPNMFKKMLAPYTSAPPRASGVAMPAMAPYQDPTNSDCFDYNVIRESPPWEMPMHCGGWQPG